MSFMRGRLRALLLGAAAGALPFAVQAQEPPVTVDSLIVTALRDPEDPPIVGDARERLSRTPGGVAVVSAETYENRYAPTLADTLRNVAGVYAQNKFGEDIRISIRGSGIGNNNHNRGLIVAQDGIPFNEADGFGDFQLADPLAARFTEVYRGGNALRFGGALLGGAVNLVTPTGRTAEAHNRLRFEAGSFDTLRLHGALAREGEAWDGFAALTGIDAGGWRQQSGTRSIRLSSNLGRSFGEGRTVRAHLYAGDVAQEIPGPLTLAQALATPRMAAPANLANNHQRNMQSLRGSVQGEWRLGEGTALSGGVYAVWKDLDHPIFQVIDQQSRTYGAFGRLDWTGDVAGRTADLFIGAWLREGNMDNQRWVNLGGGRGAQTARSFDQAGALDLFAEGRLWITDTVVAVAGGGYGRATRDFAGTLPVSLDANADYEWFSPRIGVIWQAMDGAQVYANLTRSVEPPNMGAFVQNSVPQPALKPQDAWTAEIGARGRRGDLTWDFALYRADLNNELLTFSLNPALGIPAAAFNARDTVHQGLEAALDWRFAPGWRLRQTYNWSDFRFEDDPVHGNNRLPIAPEHLYRAELRYEQDRWFVAPALEWQISEPYIDYRNTTTSPDFAIVSMTAGLSPRPGVRLFLEGRNLFDEAYVSNVSAVIAGSANSTVFWPGEGRSVFVGLTTDF